MTPDSEGFDHIQTESWRILYLYAHVNVWCPTPWQRHAPMALGALEQGMPASLAKDIDEIGHCNSVYAKGQRNAEVV